MNVQCIGVQDLFSLGGGGGAHTFLPCFARNTESMSESAPALKTWVSGEQWGGGWGGGGLVHTLFCSPKIFCLVFQYHYRGTCMLLKFSATYF